MEEVPINYKVVLLGEGEVGKTSFMFRYIDGTFSARYVSTFRMSFNIKVVTVDGHTIKLQIWDTVGQERADHTNLSRSYLRGSNGCVLIFDVTRRETFTQLPYWVDMFKEAANDPRCHNFIVAGNKTDLVDQRQVTEEEAEAWARSINAKAYFETSAKTGNGVDTAFTALSRALLASRPVSISKGVQLSASQTSARRRCCHRS